MRLLIMTALVAVFSFPAFAADKAMPMNAPTVTQSCSTTSATEAYGNKSSFDVIVSNAGAVGVFIATGDSDAIAYSSAPSGQNYIESAYVAAGSVQRFSRGATDTHVACITGSSTATIYVQSGSGE